MPKYRLGRPEDSIEKYLMENDYNCQNDTSRKRVRPAAATIRIRLNDKLFT